jgi:predicted negative regulator of RcsB-dependent stress response
MKPVVKYVIWAAIIGAVVYAGYKGYKLYQAKKAAAAVK